jgi:prolipoprotein diacylglyceryltransferase/Fe-S-cluster containining protein
VGERGRPSTIFVVARPRAGDAGDPSPNRTLLRVPRTGAQRSRGVVLQGALAARDEIGFLAPVDGGAPAGRAPLPEAPPTAAAISPRQVSEPDVAAQRDVMRGFLFANYRANIDAGRLIAASAELRAVAEQLERHGLLDRAELERRRKELAVEQEQARQLKRLHVIYDDDASDKYAAVGPQIDCASRLALCRAACCRLRFPLTQQDVREGIVAWDFAEPYHNARGPSGYCRHLDDQALGCTVYQHRPRVCRTYDCRRDSRIWIDFEARVVNPKLMQPGWPEGNEAVTVGAAPSRSSPEPASRTVPTSWLDVIARSPFLLERQDWVLSGYGVALGLAFGLGTLIWQLELARFAQASPPALVLLGIALAAFAGSKAVYFLECKLAKRWVQSKICWRGNTLTGGIAGGGLAGCIALLSADAPLRLALDCAAPGLALGWAIGKLGCLTYGCCFGRPTPSRLAVHYHHPRSKAVWFYGLRGVPLLAVPLLETISGVVLGAVALLLLPRVAGSGWAFSLVLIGYAVTREMWSPLRHRMNGERASRLVPGLAHLALGVIGIGMFLSRPASSEPLRSAGVGLDPIPWVVSSAVAALGIYLWGFHRS